MANTPYIPAALQLRCPLNWQITNVDKTTGQLQAQNSDTDETFDGPVREFITRIILAEG